MSGNSVYPDGSMSGHYDAGRRPGGDRVRSERLEHTDTRMLDAGDYEEGTVVVCIDPAVAGAAAVPASRCDARGSDLADIVRASVRPMPALKDKTRTGGMTDLSVDVNAVPQRGPVIDSMSCMGRTIILNGKGFGSSNGSVKLTKEVLGAEPKLLNAGIESWTDSRVCLLLNEETKGVLKAVLTSAVSGKTDTIVDMFSLSENIYGKDLPLDSSTGEPYLFDAPGDSETSGVLQAMGEKLYYLPAQTKVEKMPAQRDRTFTNNRKTVSVKDYKSVSKKVKGLKNGKKYYVHIRTYRTIRGQRFYSPWSKTKAVRTK